MLTKIFDDGRAIFGKVRSMTAGGLERKIDIEAYVKRVADITGNEKAE